MVREILTPALIGLLLISGSCSSRNASNPAVTLNPESLTGEYEALLPAADAPGRKVTLSLRADTTAELITEVPGREIVRQAGRWSSLPPQVRFDFRPESGRRRESLTWTIHGDQLLPLIWDKAEYGERGPVMRRVR